MSEKNIQTVRGMYEAFGRGDMAGVLSPMADDIEWAYNSSGSDVPWYPTFTGKDGVTKYFEVFLGHVEVHTLVPQDFLAGGPYVAVHTRVEYTVRKTNRRVAMHQIHWWRFTPDGQVNGMMHFEDTAAVSNAVSGR